MKSKDLTNISREHDLDISPNTRDTRNPLATMRAEMNRLTDRLFNGFNRPSTVFRCDLGSNTPQIDLNEAEKVLKLIEESIHVTSSLNKELSHSAVRSGDLSASLK